MTDPLGEVLAADLGPKKSFAITKQYRNGTVQRRYKEAIEDGIGEQQLVDDLRWMLAESRRKGNLNAMLKTWRFIMEYTVGKPLPIDLQGANTTVTIIEALERGAEYMAQFAPAEESEVPDSETGQPGDVPGTDRPPADGANP